MGKSIGKNVSKNVIGKYRQKRLDHIKQSATDIIEQQKQLVIWLVIKLLIELRKFQEIHRRIA